MARIMVVEDDVYMREELTDLLRKSGYETASLFDFENAIPKITEYSPDLVLLDINLPFHSGFEICKELKAKQLGTVLVLTARDKLQDELHALGLGADDYLTKSACLPALKIYYDAKRNRYGKAYWTGTDFYLTQTPLQFMWGRVLPSCHPMREKYCLRF